MNLAALLARAQRTLDALQRRRASREATAARTAVEAVARPQCGARCRDGHPCEAPAVWCAATRRPRNGRCRMHGGLSTGPRTVEGRERVAAATRAANLTRWSTSRP